MGRIKSTMVKKAAKQLTDKEGLTFNEDFESNSDEAPVDEAT